MAQENDTFRILLATDCHLGYKENDPVRGLDSITTFEEILKIAVKKDVDFILLGGDLFHENKPSRKILHDCMSLLRKYCQGHKPIQFKFLSDPSEIFKHNAAHAVANFQDPNLKISLPVFSIHGNHDNPSGPGFLCSLDLLCTTGLVNYFGKCTDLENINITPIMMEKNGTKLCIYGIGSIRDYRFQKILLDRKMKLLRPKEEPDDWFNLMVLHQNRAEHDSEAYVPEKYLDNFLDLVVWGHEHECLIEPKKAKQGAFSITQPGSSIATSLRQSEAVPKHVGILKIRGKQFKISKFPLMTVRQLYVKDLHLTETNIDLNSPDTAKEVTEYCREIIDGLIQKAERELSGHLKQPKQPLIRLRVFCPSSFETFNVIRFGYGYASKVANSKDIILFIHKKNETINQVKLDSASWQSSLQQDGFDVLMARLMEDYFEKSEEEKKLLVLSQIGMNSAVHEFIIKNIKQGIQLIRSTVDLQILKTRSYLEELSVDSCIDDIKKFRLELLRNPQIRNQISSISKTNDGNSLPSTSQTELRNNPVITSKKRKRDFLNFDKNTKKYSS